MDREHVESVVIADLRRANAYFEETVEPTLLERRDIFMASKDYYRKKFPHLSTKTDYRSFDFYAYVQWAKAPILESFFGTSKVVHVVGCGPEDESSAKLMEKLLTWQLTQQSGGYQICEDWIEDGLVYEFGILKVWWERSTGKRDFTEEFPVDQAMSLMNQPDVEVKNVSLPNYWGDVEVSFTKEFLLENKIRFDNVSPFDMRWSPEARTLDTANFVAQRQFVSIADLLEGVEREGYDKKIVDEIAEGGGGVSFTTSDSLRNPELDNIGQEEDKARSLVELYECYVNLDVDGDGKLKPMIVTVANDKILRIVPNGFEQTPFFQLSAHRDSSKAFPTDISMADIEGELQHLHTAMIRQLEINLSISNQPRKFINATTVNMDDFLADRVFVRCNDNPGQAIVSEQPTQIASWTMPFFELTKSMEEEWTGRTRYNQGMQADTLNKTAAGISLIMKASSQRINTINKNFAESGFKRMVKFSVLLNQRYMDQKQMIRVFGQPLEIAPDDLHGDLDVVVETDVGLSKQSQEINALTEYLKEVYPYASQLGIVTPEQFQNACIRALELSGLSGASQYFLTPEQIQQRQMQAQAQAAQLQGAQDAQRQVMALAGKLQQGNAPGPAQGIGAGQQGGGVPAMAQ
jgi:hypothetical protein